MRMAATAQEPVSMTKVGRWNPQKQTVVSRL
jgi:hypothetical protein